MGPTRVTRGGLDALAHGGHLDAVAWRRAGQLAGFAPDGARWRALLEGTFAIGGALLLGAALVFFIAYNWTEMGRFARLGLVEAAVFLCAVAATWLGPRTLGGRAALLLGLIATGGLLALIGQTYQTGADPWQLFAAWAALCVPWALAAGWAPTWLVALACVDLAIGLYFAQVARPFHWLGGDASMLAILGAANVAAAVAAEWLGPKDDDGVHRLLPRAAMVTALGAATIGAILWIFSWTERSPILIAELAAIMGGTFWAYRHRSRDLLILSAWALGGIAVVAAFLGHLAGQGGRGENWFLLIAIAIIGLSAWAATWIRGLAKEGA